MSPSNPTQPQPGSTSKKSLFPPARLQPGGPAGFRLRGGTCSGSEAQGPGASAWPSSVTVGEIILSMKSLGAAMGLCLLASACICLRAANLINPVGFGSWTWPSIAKPRTRCADSRRRARRTSHGWTWNLGLRRRSRPQQD